MTPSQESTFITLMANLLAEHLSEEEAANVASILTQLGGSLAFVAARKALQQQRKTKKDSSTKDKTTNDASNS
ncbi:MAG: hypothetical protein SOR61_01150 [Evtepia sp.]|uniref:hypothetical protein n=1 Tax=Evtepia sp. TaxID=2773933 RepID=UPI002A75FAA9|nr:hypothetical protein [Evtepia sp.]MDY3013806.1 hypothetical protein [Evtepia sp.]